MVSYKTENRGVAEEISGALAGAGFAPWMDFVEIRPGMSWRPSLLNEVRSCDAFVALLTRNYVQSEHCRMEVFIARSRGCPVLPVMLEDCFDLLDEHEETKGLAETFMVRLYRLSVVGLPVTRPEAIQRVVDAARAVGQEFPRKAVYVAYCNEEAVLATRIADGLQACGIPAWVATRDCVVGQNWRQAQARGVMNAAIQVVVVDETIGRAEVLRTEILLAEAFDIPVLTVTGERLTRHPEALGSVMKELRTADITYNRLTQVQPFGCDDASLEDLAATIRSRI